MTFSKWWLVVAAVFLIGLIAFLWSLPLPAFNSSETLMTDWAETTTVGDASTLLFGVIFFATLLANLFSK